MTQKQNLVIAGNGMAPVRMLENLIEASDAFDVTIFNAEPRVSCGGIRLSPVLSGQKSLAPSQTDPLTNWALSLETGEAQSAVKGKTDAFPVKLEA